MFFGNYFSSRLFSACCNVWTKSIIINIYSAHCNQFQSSKYVRCNSFLTFVWNQNGESHKKILKIPVVFRIPKSKDRQHNDQTKKENKNDLQNIMRNTKDLATRKTITDEHMCSGRVISSCSTSGTRHVALIANS